ncbi:MAG: disulfide interchange protein [Beijerinckiaceae bacterium]|nr:MAG: disulfide interchange protein [Beijerinckiaceae bacterium]
MSNPPEPPRTPRKIAVGPLVLALILAVASLYAFGGFGNLSGGKTVANAGQCKAAAAKVASLKPLAKGEVAALQVPDRPAPVVSLSFFNAKGEAVTLAAFRGRTVLLNLWATWCVPCRKEMPALDAVQAELGSKNFEVVAVSIDQRNLEKPRQFLEEIKVTHLAYYADPSAKIFQDLKAAGRAFGMPTTLLIDAQGCELAYIAGPAEWASPEALAFVRAALK